MGDIAESMIGGEMCATCGEYIGCDDYGIPMYCSIECAKEQGAGINQVCKEQDFA